MANENSPSKFIHAKVIDNTVTLLVSRPESYFRVYGASMPMSVSPKSTGYDKQRSVTLYPEKGKEGFIALIILGYVSRDHKGRIDQVTMPVMIRITWKDQDGQTVPQAELNTEWISTKRIGQATDDGIEAMIGGRWFTSYGNHGGKKVLVDGNLLCHYLWGTAHAADVLHTVVQQKLEPLASRRVEQMTNEVRVLSHEVQRLNGQLKWLGSERQTLIDDYFELSKKMSSYEYLYNVLTYIPARLRPKAVKLFIEAMDSVK